MLKPVLVLAAASIAVTGCTSMLNQQWHSNCTVTSKITVTDTTDGTSTRTNRLGTSCGTFEVGDSVAGGFNSWDTWTALQEGKTYDIKTGGYRFGWASTFPVVLEYNEVNR